MSKYKPQSRSSGLSEKPVAAYVSARHASVSEVEAGVLTSAPLAFESHSRVSFGSKVY